MRTLLPVLLLAAVACESDNGLQKVTDRYGQGEGSITGRVCDEERAVWLEGASVYTHIIDSSGELRDTRTTLSDADGYYTLDNLDNDTYRVYIQYGSTTIDMFDVDVLNARETEVPSTTCAGSAGLDVAVVTGDFDDMDTVLEAAGIGGYNLVNGQTGDELLQFLQNPAELATYDAIFFSGGHLEEGVFYSTDGSATATAEAVQEGLRSYVKGGGVVIASDWSYDVIEQTWPSKMTFIDESRPDASQVGEPVNLSVTVSGSDLKDELGQDTLKVNFDLDAWPVVDSVEDEVKVFLRGDAPWRIGMDTGTESNSPMMVEFTEGKGTVVYVPFRMSANLEGKPGKAVKWLLERELGSGE